MVKVGLGGCSTGKPASRPEADLVDQLGITG